MVRQRDILKIPYADIGVDHDTIASNLDEKIFGILKPAEGYDGADHFLASEHDTQLILFPETLDRLSQICRVLSGEDESTDGWQSFYYGGVVAFAVLDEIADARGIARADYRDFWLSMRCANGAGAIDLLIDVDEEVIRATSTHYEDFAAKIADEVAKDDQELDDFIEGFRLMVVSGKLAMAKHMLSVAAIKTSHSMAAVNLATALEELTTKEQVPGYNTNVTQDFTLLQRMFDDFFADKEMTNETGYSFSKIIIDRIVQSRGHMNLAPKENTPVRITSSKNAVVFPNKSVSSGPGVDAKAIYFRQNDIITGKFVHVVSVARFPSPNVIPENFDADSDMLFGPALVLSEVSVKDESGNDTDHIDTEMLVMIPLMQPEISILYNL